MVELSIDEKAKRYDEILARAKGANIPYYKDDIMSKVKEFVDYLLPELKESKESEDERIREVLVRFHKGTIDIDGINGEEILAWLEKQGEQKPKFRIGDTIKKESTGDIVTISEIDLKNREYRLSNTGFIPFKYEHLWELVEQNPAWSEEDEFILEDAITAVDLIMTSKFQESNPNLYKSFEVAKHWLKSLRPQNRWKPSDEQMDNLYSLIYKGTFNKGLIAELYGQLKAL